MVARICAQNPKYAGQRALAEATIERADVLRLALIAARERDEAAFAEVIDAHALPKATEAEGLARRAALETALAHAATEPLRAAGLCLQVLALCENLLAMPNRNLASDVGCAAEFAGAALAACAYNVRVNHLFMKDALAIAEQSAALGGYETEAAERLTRLRAAVGELLA